MPSQRRPKVSRVCEHCKNPFLAHQCEIDIGYGRFCCRACKDAAGRNPLTMAERLWKKVNKDGPIPPHRPELGPCWVWTGNTNRQGYGLVYVSYGLTAVHRLSWKLHNETIPDGLWVLHKCDNPPCVNPVHLFLGTCADNEADKVAKGRQARGERIGGAKLTEAGVCEIRARRAAGESTRTLADELHVHISLIRLIDSRKIWKHI